MNQHGNPPFLFHNPIEFGPVVVAPARGPKYRTQQAG
jgi:hypothetical protein